MVAQHEASDPSRLDNQLGQVFGGEIGRKGDGAKGRCGEREIWRKGDIT